MWDVLKEYPAARVRLEAIAVKRLEKYKKAPLENAARSRSHSTPGLVESIGQVPLDQMWIPPVSPVGYAVPSTPGSPGARSRDTRQTLESPLSDPASSRRESTEVNDIALPAVISNEIQSNQIGTAGSVASSDSEKRSVTTMPYSYAASSNAALSSSAVTTATASSSCVLLSDIRPSHPQHYALPNFMHHYTNEQILIPSQLQHSYAGLDRRSSAEALMAEISRLRERLQLLETENAAMSAKLNRQQWEVENRLAEIEMQICGASSGDSDATEDNERNRESAI